MFVGHFDPDQRARDKAEARLRDEEALSSGQVSREQLQFMNGGNGLFRRSLLVGKPRQQRSSEALIAAVG
jgi:hypothetical protein